ncbi:MAG: YidC/Oxa1 family membrane protein insertase [Clostridia bacterium]|nr:YidC/Oxa1 family membrane protein insertase [Clostridia bacterium]
MNLLATSTSFISFMVKNIEAVDLNWIGEIVKWIIEGVGITAVGILLFTLVLKTIVLPLDVYSKYKTKKQSLLMEQMRPQMEKLQKQYENDKNMYNQKVAELYKKNGYSMMGVCLPTIVSLVIFMVVFSQFSTYSQYANLELYRGMVNAYNGVVAEYVYDDNWTYSSDKPANGFLIETEDSDGETAYYVDYTLFETYYKAKEETKENATKYEELIADAETENDMILVVKDYIRDYARAASAAYYEENLDGFIWVGNIWYPDSMLNKELPSFSKFQSTLSRASIDDNYEESYNEVTYNLTDAKDTYNGYFVLIVLAIGMMFLSQFVTMRMQKSMNELGSVDGSAARTNKWMLILMPVIYGIFSFFYSAAFSIYMITNTTYSLITSLIVNRTLNVKFKKLEERNELDRYLHKSAEKKEMRKNKKKR